MMTIRPSITFSDEAETSALLSSPNKLSQGKINGEIKGYASLFGVVDTGGDEVMPGAFQNSLKQRSASGIRMLYQHDPNTPIGVWQTIKETSKGLYVHGHLTMGVVKAREILALIYAGGLDGLSIGFRTIKSSSKKRQGIRYLYEIDLWEVSIVTFPMLPGARISAVKTDALANMYMNASHASLLEMFRQAVQKNQTKWR